MVSITHKYVSTNGDPPDSSLIGQTKWNDDHNVVGLTPGVDIQPYSPNLDSWSLVAPGSYLTVAAAAASYQPLATTLTSWASVTRASGFDTFVATPSSANLRSLLTDETGTGAAVFANAPTLVSPVLGTPTSGNLANCTSYPLAQLSGAGTSVLTALSVNVGSAGAFVIFNGALGTPSSGTLTNCSGLPVSGIAASTSQPIGVGSIELGHASDTTLSRASAGRLAIEGVNVVTVSSTDTLTNKTLTDPIVGTQTVLDNSTKAASTAYVDRTTREKLTANRTYYVRTDGSDSNTGLANTSGGAFLTVQKAVDVATTLDLNGYTLTIQIADGTYTGATTLKNVVGFAGAGSLVIKGNNSTPANVLISTTSVGCFTANGTNVVWDILDLKMQTTTGGACLQAQSGGAIRYGNVNFGACANVHIGAFENGSVVCIANYAISGGALTHFYGSYMGLVRATSRSITITGTPAFSLAFAFSDLSGLVAADAMTFSGSATGPRYYVATGGQVATGGGGTSYLPGNAAGTGTNFGTWPYGLYS